MASVNLRRMFAPLAVFILVFCQTLSNRNFIGRLVSSFGCLSSDDFRGNPACAIKNGTANTEARSNTSQPHGWLDTSINTTVDTMNSSKVAIFVLSARSHSERRQAIRETWAKGHIHIFFVIGAGCPVPADFRDKDLYCIVDSDLTEDNQTKARISEQTHEHLKVLHEEDKLLVEEQRVYRDMIWTDEAGT
jgi:hypothetical protein